MQQNLSTNSDPDCLFCKIVNGAIPSTMVYETKRLIAFRDIHPLTPVHILIVPRQHIPSFNELDPTDFTLLSEMTEAVHKLAASEHIAESGYRLVVNINADGGQEVMHLHWHLLGGCKLGRILTPRVKTGTDQDDI